MAPSGCATVQGSAVATATAEEYHGAVTLSALTTPAGTQVGLVEARGVGTLKELMEEFAHQVKKVGGNVGKIDSLRSKFEWQTSTQTYTYSCGTPTSPMTCTGTRTVTTEVMTTTAVGRAFRTEGS